MIATEPATPSTLEAYPEFDLHARYDDLADPSELTVYSVADTDDPTTTWLSIDVEHAIPLEDLR